MGGGPPQPERPKRQRSRDPDCARYVSGGVARIVVGGLFGLPFFCGGILCLATFVAVLLGFAEDQPDFSGVKWFIGMLAFVTLGLAHTTVGFLMLRGAVCSPEWIVIDRLHGWVRRQTGVLFFRRVANESLDKFTEVSIFPISATWRDNIFSNSTTLFEVALTGPTGIRFPIGRVTLSADLAREFGREVATFLNLPLS